MRTFTVTMYVEIHPMWAFYVLIKGLFGDFMKHVTSVYHFLHASVILMPVHSYGGAMTEDMLDDFGNDRDPPSLPASVRLIIVPDLLDKDWTHFYTPRAFTTTFGSLPNGLSNKLRAIVNGLIQRSITRLDYDSTRTHQALVDIDTLRQHPFDLRLLRENEDFEDLFEAVNWWIEREQRKFRCGFDTFHHVQARKTWTCECGAVVNVEKKFVEMCDNQECPTWEKQAFCLGKKIKRNLRLA